MSAQEIGGADSPSAKTQDREDASRKRSIAPWIVLALWVAWLAVVVVLSFPYWGGSKAQIRKVREVPAEEK
ncbi:MAG TPA: hypothetical protein VKX17_15925 [Planctomycetota bacterium]|nr:hypothetical protein [Planctomycetota bacterium]